MTETSSITVVDSHVHFWDRSVFTYPWLDDLDEISGPHLPHDVPTHVPGASVEQLVFVQAECLPVQAVDEVDWVTSLAATDKRVSAIVAFAPLETPAAGEILDRLEANPLVRGIRRLIQGEAPGFASRIVTGVRSLGPRGLSFDICISHEQLPEVIELVDSAPETRFVLDHIGKPNIRSAEWSPWAEDIAALAKRRNVWCKLSGMVTEADHTGWTRADLEPYAAHVLDVFGSDRVMFGSDWPVATLATDYETWLSVARSLVGGNADDIEAVFWGTARTFYRLGAGT